MDERSVSAATIWSICADMSAQSSIWPERYICDNSMQKGQRNAADLLFDENSFLLVATSFYSLYINEQYRIFTVGG